MALALYPRHELAKDANVAPDGHGFNGISLAYNVRNRAEVDSVIMEAAAGGGNSSQTCPESILGRLFGILRRSGWGSVGGRLESIFPDSAGWKYSHPGISRDPLPNPG